MMLCHVCLSREQILDRDCEFAACHLSLMQAEQGMVKAKRQRLGGFARGNTTRGLSSID